MLAHLKILLDHFKLTPRNVHYCLYRVAGLWLAFVERSRIPQRFRRARICKFSRQKHCFFYDWGKTGNLWLSKDLNTHRHISWNTLLDVHIYTSFNKVSIFLKLFENSTKALQKPSERFTKAFSESSTKALRKRALWNLSDFCWKPFLKQAKLGWKLSQSRMTFVESPMKAFQKTRKSRQYSVLRQNSICWGSFLS